jgi:hypothetical protein
MGSAPHTKCMCAITANASIYVNSDANGASKGKSDIHGENTDSNIEGKKNKGMALTGCAKCGSLLRCRLMLKSKEEIALSGYKKIAQCPLCNSKMLSNSIFADMCEMCSI